MTELPTPDVLEETQQTIMECLSRLPLRQPSPAACDFAEAISDFAEDYIVKNQLPAHEAVRGCLISLAALLNATARRDMLGKLLMATIKELGQVTLAMDRTSERPNNAKVN